VPTEFEGLILPFQFLITQLRRAKEERIPVHCTFKCKKCGYVNEKTMGMEQFLKTSTFECKKCGSSYYKEVEVKYKEPL